jgi:exodeoxyribonuclease VII large subunit
MTGMGLGGRPAGNKKMAGLKRSRISGYLRGMGRPAKSQWDFGELFPTEQIRKVLSVTELSWQIRTLLEKQVGQVWVTGEVSNLRAQASGHMYFTLKDAAAQLRCVLFRGEVQVDRALVQEGQKLIVQGEVTVYEARGEYQLRVTGVELRGVGALQAAFEKLKQKLKAEGLFATDRKRPLPRYPQRIGLATSPDGAALRDVLHVVRRRNPALEIVLAPCRVQGEGAGLEIAAAIRLLNAYDASSRRGGEAVRSNGVGLDLILVTRGGGSLEDLWAFNEEVVARAIFHSELPVVSAVGHEIDFTISDFVADLRAATPSAAAELITEGVFSSWQFIGEAEKRLAQLSRKQLARKQDELGDARRRLAREHPRRRLNDRLQRLDDLQGSLMRCLKRTARQRHQVWQSLAERLSRVRPSVLLRQRQELFEQARERLREQASHRLKEVRNRVGTLEVQLRLLGPEQVLARGYSITMDAGTGQVLREAEKVRAGQRLRTRLKSGVVTSRAEPTGDQS